MLFLLSACGGGAGDRPVPEVVSQAAASLTFDAIRGVNTDPAAVTSDLDLPATGAFGAGISWLSSDTGLVEINGRVHRPTQSVGNQSVVLTATVSLDGASEIVVFNLIVLALPDVFNYIYSGSGYDIDHVDTPQTDTADSQISYQLDLGTATKDVYFIFTNTSLLDTSAPSLVADSYPVDQMIRATVRGEERGVWARRNGIGLSGRPDVRLFNSDPERFGHLRLEAAPPGQNRNFQQIPPEPLRDSVGNSTSFSLDLTATQTIDATCRKVISANGKTLNIWVADDSWQGAGCTRTNCLDQAMVDSLGDKFLLSGDDNDIYQWVSNVFGAEWGGQPFPNMIGADNNITILLHDIGADNSINGGTLGFFWAKDNFRNSGADSVAGSNQRIMFYIDSVMFATAEGVSWDLNDTWPNKLIGTLGHEFQHMIHYYQKSVLNYPATSETWLNEMCSMVTEDLLQTKAAIDGPRAVSYLDGSAGGPGNISGRLPRFVRFDYSPLAEWLGGSFSDPGDNNVLNSYAVNYAYGAFLARNFGGPALFRAIVQGNLSGADAISSALITAGFSNEDFTSTLRKWGPAVLLSDDVSTDVPADYRYNTGGFSGSFLGTISYDLGSINLFNYIQVGGGQVGPRVYTSLPAPDGNAGKYKTSNIYYRLGSGLSGLISSDITLRKGHKMTVLIK